MGKGHRQERLGGEIQKIISTMLLRDLKDPRLQNAMVSVTAVDVTNDGSYATVFLTVLGYGQQTPETKAKQENDALEALKHAKGVIKKEIGKQIKLRHIPELIFKIDTSLEYGRHIEEVLHNLNK
jgi:ribosome-binding factor A